MIYTLTYEMAVSSTPADNVVKNIQVQAASETRAREHAEHVLEATYPEGSMLLSLEIIGEEEE